MSISINGNGITSANIADGAITNADIADVAASKLTGALPAISGAALTNLPGGGKVLQVIHEVDTTRVTISATSFTAVHISATITPISTSSKILVHLNFGVNDNTTSDVIAYTTIYRGATNLGNSNYGFAKLRCTSARIETMQSIMYLDSPNTTSATTYSMYAKVTSGAFEFPGAAGMPTTMTLMEIAG